MDHHLSGASFFGLVVVMLGAAKLAGAAARRVGQPPVLGELAAGVIVGKHALGLVDPSLQVWHLLSELGVAVLLFSIGLETDLRGLLRVGPVSAVVAVAGVVFPFVLGYATCRLLGLDGLVSVVAGATLTATSVGITARVLSEIGQLRSPESQVILGAAVIDDVVGLVILTVVRGVADGQSLAPGNVAWSVGTAFGFLLATALTAVLIVPKLLPRLGRLTLPGSSTVPALMLALGLAWLADRCGSAAIIGAFAAGLILARTPRIHEIETGVVTLSEFFVPLFFVTVGASVDVRVLNPTDPANRRTLLIACLLSVVAIAGKFAAGYAPFWVKARKSIIGAGMIPRGEVGLIFAQMGLTVGVFDPGMFAAVTLVVMTTTFVAPPLLKYLSGPINTLENQTRETSS